MATNNQVDVISELPVLTGGSSIQVDVKPVIETDLHAVDALGVVGHGLRPISEYLSLAVVEVARAGVAGKAPIKGGKIGDVGLGVFNHESAPMNANIPDLEAQVAEQQRSISALQVVVLALLETHPDKGTLLRVFDHHAFAKHSQEQGSAIPDTDRELLEAKLGLWRRWIS